MVLLATGIDRRDAGSQRGRDCHDDGCTRTGVLRGLGIATMVSPSS
jgi:hypothetical protein